MELKVTPYVRTRSGIRSKERLVCNIINYSDEAERTFYTSSFWQKCENMFLMFYEHQSSLDKKEWFISHAGPFQFPDEDRAILQKDWETIIVKVKAGLAHTISEGDTLYLAACTKGVNAESTVKQPFSDIPAKQRAYSLKPSYMTQILNRYFLGAAEDEHVVTDPDVLVFNSFESYIQSRMSPYFGLTTNELAIKFGIIGTPKNINELIVSRIFGIRGKLAETDEFKKASIVPKTIRVQRNGKIKESMSFPTFEFTKIVKEAWEDSDFHYQLAPTRFMFIIFQERDDGEYVLNRIKFWNIPDGDLDEAGRVWKRTTEIVKDGVEIRVIKGKKYNNLPKKSESSVAHVRPHGRDSSDTYPLPDGREMTVYCKIKM